MSENHPREVLRQRAADLRSRAEGMRKRRAEHAAEIATLDERIGEAVADAAALDVAAATLAGPSPGFGSRPAVSADLLLDVDTTRVAAVMDRRRSGAHVADREG